MSLYEQAFSIRLLVHDEYELNQTNVVLEASDRVTTFLLLVRYTILDVENSSVRLEDHDRILANSGSSNMQYNKIHEITSHHKNNLNPNKINDKKI